MARVTSAEGGGAFIHVDRSRKVDERRLAVPARGRPRSRRHRHALRRRRHNPGRPGRLPRPAGRRSPPFDPPAGAEFAIEAATAVVAIVVALALVAVPARFVAIRQPYRTGSGRTLLVGDGPVFGNLSADFAV